jgi:hypothetical protein
MREVLAIMREELTKIRKGVINKGSGFDEDSRGVGNKGRGADKFSRSVGSKGRGADKVSTTETPRTSQ